jgi:orotate phosphoribosyltransferase
MTTLVDDTIAKHVSKLLLTIKAVTINTKKPYRYTSGMLAPMYTDNRLIMSYPKVWNKIIDYYIEAIEKVIGKKHVEVLSGTATAAIPHAAALATRMKLPMVYVRSSKKEHGKENQIEGTFKKGSKVLVIEDLISTGGSAKTNADAVRGEGGTVHHCLAITTSTLHAFEPIMKEAKLTLHTLTNVAVTLDVAAGENYITAKQKKIAQEFFVDPKNWGKKMGFER